MKGADITVCTITLANVDPQRAELLDRAVRSVNAQTTPVREHLVDLTYPADFGDLYNGLVERARTSFVLFLDDDNYLFQRHVEKLLPLLEGADVAYSFEDSGTRPRVDVTDWAPEYIERLGRHSNWLDTCAVVRKSAFLEVGGFAGVGGTSLKDWDLWRRMAKAGARFRCLPEVTWHYQVYALDGHVYRERHGIKG